jgi:hypothetical protein
MSSVVRKWIDRKLIGQAYYTAIYIWKIAIPFPDKQFKNTGTAITETRSHFIYSGEQK